MASPSSQPVPKQGPTSSVHTSPLAAEFQTFYRRAFDYKSYQQLKVEKHACIRDHCHALYQPRFAKFNHERAAHCTKLCSRTFERLQAQQSAAISGLPSAIKDRCGEQSAQAEFQECREGVFREAVAGIDSLMATLTKEDPL